MTAPQRRWGLIEEFSKRVTSQILTLKDLCDGADCGKREAGRKERRPSCGKRRGEIKEITHILYSYYCSDSRRSRQGSAARPLRPVVEEGGALSGRSSVGGHGGSGSNTTLPPTWKEAFASSPLSYRLQLP